MAYQQPMVMVYQEYDSTSTSSSDAWLPACIVGPCYHIIDPAEDEILALFGTYTKDGITDGMFPNNAPGALIDRSSVTFRFKNAMVELAERVYAKGTNSSTVWASGESMTEEDGDWGFDTGDGTGDVETDPDVIPTGTGTPLVNTDGVKGNNYTVATPSDIANVVVGDYVAFPDDDTEYRVIGVNLTEGTLILNKACPSNRPISLLRKIEEFTLVGDEVATLDLTSERFSIFGVSYLLDETEYPVRSAELYVGYKALRQDLSGLNTFYTVDEVEGQLGKITPENPLAFGVSIAIANGSQGVMAIGVDSDDLAGYTAAKDRIEQEDPIYGIVPLTFDTGVLTMFKNHCEEYSDPKFSRWRMAFGCTKLVTEKTICEGYGMVSYDGDGDLVIFNTNDSNIAFRSSQVDAGDTLTLVQSNGFEYDFTIASIPSEDILTITQSNPFDATVFVPGSTTYKFRITHKMSRKEQAEWIRDASKAYGYRRFVNIFPDVCVVDDQEVPGYYLGCAVASGVASLPSHYGMTKLSVSGISAVKGSSDHFNNDELNIIADGGTFIFVQQNPSAAPYIRHQLTTDTSAIEYGELSFVKNFDYISYVCRDVMDEFLGKWNITPHLLGAIKTALNATLENIKLSSEPKIGSRLLSYNIISVEQLADIRDRVEAYVEVSMPYPLNTIGLHLKSVFLQVTSS